MVQPPKEQKIIHRVTHNDEWDMAERFSKDDRKAFFSSSKIIVDAWMSYLEFYVDRTSEILDKSELPWSKFDEQTWVSSLAIAIAKGIPNSLVIEEIPVVKSVKSDKQDRSNGNADMWCCLDASSPKSSFSFYLEAKVSSKKKRDIKEGKLTPISWVNSGNEITQSRVRNQDSHFSRAIRDYLKSTGTKLISSRSPHANEEGRKHKHAFLALILLPVEWKGDEEWPEKIEYKQVFEKSHIEILTDRLQGDKTIQRSIDNIPATCVLMREEKTNQGCIALMMMLGISNEKGKRS